MATSDTPVEAPARKPSGRTRARLQRSISGVEQPAVEEDNNSLVLYRSVGLGGYGAALRFAGMPLERIALISNSTQIKKDAGHPLRQAVRLAFQDGALAPYRVVGRASIVAWFLQYSVMGFVFQSLDVLLSKTIGTERVPYGSQIMQKPPKEGDTGYIAGSERVKYVAKTSMVPMCAGAIESVVSNRAEVQRYYGIEAFGKIEKQLGSNPVARACGPAFVANTMRNFVMSTTSFVMTPTLYQLYYPQEKKSTTSLFWFGLGLNIFAGNVVAITQQSLWGRVLDYMAVGGGRNACYRTILADGYRREGAASLFTVPKWFSRVLMNAPAEGTLAWFYNRVLPVFEPSFLRAADGAYAGVRRWRPFEPAVAHAATKRPSA